MSERSGMRRVAVTGVGVITGFGSDENDLWRQISAGGCCIRRIRAFDPADYKCAVAGEVDDSILDPALKEIGLNRSDRTVDFAFVAAHRALRQAGLMAAAAPDAALNAAVVVGTGVGSAQSLYESFQAFHQKGIRGLRPTSVPRCMANAACAQLSIRYRLTGPNYAVVSACTSSTTAVGIAFRMVRDGYADLALCGGADAFLDPFVFGGWNNLGVMSKNADPLKACRPFDAARDGCVLGEGAGMLVLETWDHAHARGAAIRAEVLGFGESSDAAHITRPDADGQAAAIGAALRDAGVTASEIGYVNAHGTATRANDEVESRSVRLALGTEADRVPVSSLKPHFGHLLGASGAVETIVSILAMENRVIPPALNLDNPDPACAAVRLVRAEPVPLAAPCVLKNSFGFGGNNAVLVLRAAR